MAGVHRAHQLWLLAARVVRWLYPPWVCAWVAATVEGDDNLRSIYLNNISRISRSEMHLPIYTCISILSRFSPSRHKYFAVLTPSYFSSVSSQTLNLPLCLACSLPSHLLSLHLDCFFV